VYSLEVGIVALRVFSPSTIRIATSFSDVPEGEVMLRMRRVG